MDVYFRDDTQLLATYVGGVLRPAPGVDPDEIGLVLFKMLAQLLGPDQMVPKVTWGTMYRPGAVAAGPAFS